MCYFWTRNLFSLMWSKNGKWHHRSTPFVKQTYFGKFRDYSMSLTWETEKSFQNAKNLVSKSDWASKLVICTCTEATDGCRFDLKILLSKFWYLDQSFISIPQMVLKLSINFVQRSLGCSPSCPMLKELRLLKCLNEVH